MFVGAMVLVISLAHVPAAWGAVEYFDPPKRLLWAFAALVLAALGCGRDLRMGRGGAGVAWALLLWMGVRTVFRPVPAAEIEVLCVWVLPVVMLMLGSDVRFEGGRRIVGGSLLAAGLIQAGLMGLQRAGWDPLFGATTAGMAYEAGRMVGTIGYHNQAVDFLALSGVGVFALTRSGVVRLAAWAPVLAMAAWAGNRGGIVAFGAAVLASQVAGAGSRADARRRMGIGLLLVAGVAGVAATIPETRARFHEVFAHFRESSATASRLHMVRIGADMFLERPWTGWGAGEYALQYLDRLGGILAEPKTHAELRTVFFAREAHNDGLQFAAEFGLVGVSLAVALLAGLVARLARARGEGGGAAPMGYVLGYMGVAGLFSFPWQTSMAGPLGGFLVGWLWPRGPGGDPVRAHRLTRLGLMGVAVGLVAWWGWDVFLDVAVPARLAAGDPQAAERILPAMDHRYRALVGAAHAAQGRWDKAARALERSLRGRRDVLAWNNLNHVYARQGRWAECVEICEKWERCGLMHPEAMKNLSIAYEQTGRFAEAAEVEARRMEMWHTCAPGEVQRLAVLRLRAGDPGGAREVLDTYRRRWATADSRTVAELENLTGAAHVALGDGAEARKWFESALARDPGLESARRNLAGLPGEAPPAAGERPAE